MSEETQVDQGEIIDSYDGGGLYGKLSEHIANEAGETETPAQAEEPQAQAEAPAQTEVPTQAEEPQKTPDPFSFTNEAGEFDTKGALELLNRPQEAQAQQASAYQQALQPKAPEPEAPAPAEPPVDNVRQNYFRMSDYQDELVKSGNYSYEEAYRIARQEGEKSYEAHQLEERLNQMEQKFEDRSKGLDYREKAIELGPKSAENQLEGQKRCNMKTMAEYKTFLMDRRYGGEAIFRDFLSSDAANKTLQGDELLGALNKHFTVLSADPQRLQEIENIAWGKMYRTLSPMIQQQMNQKANGQAAQKAQNTVTNSAVERPGRLPSSKPTILDSYRNASIN